jgi:hypothetical protein
MTERSPTSIARLVALGLVILNIVLWLQGQHMAPAAHERVLIALVALGYVTWWITQERR